MRLLLHATWIAQVVNGLRAAHEASPSLENELVDRGVDVSTDLIAQDAEGFHLVAAGSSRKRQSGVDYIDFGGTISNDCYTVPIYRITNGTLTATLEGTTYYYSTTPGLTRQVFAPTRSPGSITTRFSLDGSGALRWSNAAFDYGVAEFCSTPNATVYAIFDRSSRPEGCIAFDLELFSTSTCQGMPVAGSSPRSATSTSSTSTSTSIRTTTTRTTTTTTTTTAVRRTVTSTGCATLPTTVALNFRLTIATEFGESIRVVGSIPAFGTWTPNNGLALNSSQYTDADPVWIGTVRVASGTSFQYKYVRQARGVDTWEEDPNRSYTVTANCAGAYTIYETWNDQTQRTFVGADDPGVALNGQCGGQNSDGTAWVRACAAPGVCRYQSDTYSQCQ